ncbi:MAG: archaellin/type IV pilin N-terminal domain-containing protein [Thermoplasmata archaeon]
MRVPRTLRSRLRSLRRGRRGVSPVIATILLVAITVILAGTLYVFLINYFPSTANTPLQDALGYGSIHCLGAPSTGCTNSTGSVGCAAGDYCWSIAISTANGPSPSSIILYVQNASTQTISTASWHFTFLTVNNPPAIVANATGSVAGQTPPGWIAGPGRATNDALTTGMILWIDTGSSTPYTGQSLTLNTDATGGGYGGALNPSTLPT